MTEKKELWEPIEILVESGGINYGLLPVEAGFHLGLDSNLIKVLIIKKLENLEILSIVDEKEIVISNGVINILKKKDLDDFEKRIEISNHSKNLVNDYEYMLIQLTFPLQSEKIIKIKSSILEKRIMKEVDSKMTGYDSEQTKEHYQKLINYLDAKGGWANREDEKEEWLLIKKALEVNPELSIPEILENLSL